MEKNIYVVTDPQAGWDCVRGVYLAKNEEEVYTYLYYDWHGPAAEPPSPFDIEELEEMYVVHTSRLKEL